MQQTGDKFIVLENGGLEIVLMSFKEYERLAGGHAKQEVKEDLDHRDYQEEFMDLDPRGLRETELIASVELSSTPALTESIGLPVRLEDIRLEDLPI